MEDQQTKQLSGIPGLAQIPILRYLFGQTTQDHSQNQIVFAIVPHIIRRHEVDEINQRAIDIGTATTISLHHEPKAGAAAPTSTGQPSSITPTGPGGAAQPGTRPAPAAQQPPSGTANFLFDPPTIQVDKGKTFAVNLLISGAQNVYSVPVQVNYDPKMLQLVNVSNGGFLSQDGQVVTVVHREDEMLGQSQITASRPSGAAGVSGQGCVVTLTFEAKSTGQTPLTITRGGARDPGLQAIAVNGAQASVTVQ